MLPHRILKKGERLVMGNRCCCTDRLLGIAGQVAFPLLVCAFGRAPRPTGLLASSCRVIQRTIKSGIYRQILAAISPWPVLRNVEHRPVACGMRLAALRNVDHHAACGVAQCRSYAAWCCRVHGRCGCAGYGGYAQGREPAWQRLAACPFRTYHRGGCQHHCGSQTSCQLPRSPRTRSRTRQSMHSVSALSALLCQRTPMQQRGGHCNDARKGDVTRRRRREASRRPQGCLRVFGYFFARSSPPRRSVSPCLLCLTVNAVLL